jgi:cytochrome c oxidase assembly protein subunit 15
VVDTNLKPISITLHMMSALVLIGITIFTMARVRARSTGETKLHVKGWLIGLVILALLATLDQVIFGTQVRQQIDTINANMSGLSRETWIAQLDGVYLYHKLMAGFVALLNIALALLIWKMRPDFRTKSYALMILLLVLGEYGAGVMMHNFAVPKFLQPVHLVLAMILFGFQFGLLMRLKKAGK